MMKDTYIKLLRDVLERKLQVMDQILALSEQQERIITADTFEEKQFFDMIDRKSDQIDKLNQLDKGFEQIYHNVNEELLANKDLYKDYIITLQDLIKKITDKSINNQVLEKRNRDKLEVFLSRKRKDIKESRTLGKNVTNYYKTMAQHNDQQSYFYDKKN